MGSSYPCRTKTKEFTVHQQHRQTSRLFNGGSYNSPISKTRKVGIKQLLVGILAGLSLGTTVAAPLSVSAMDNERDWDQFPVPADAGPGMRWQLQNVSDDFNYRSTYLSMSPEFTQRWGEGFINPWTGPGLTTWTVGHAYVNDGQLGIHASRQPGTNRVRLGSITSKESFTYPLYVEANAKISKMVLANNVWLLSQDSTEEIDILEAYGSDRPEQRWFAERIHLSHHVFIREPFQDYQPRDAGSWFTDGGTFGAMPITG